MRASQNVLGGAVDGVEDPEMQFRRADHLADTLVRVVARAEHASLASRCDNPRSVRNQYFAAFIPARSLTVAQNLLLLINTYAPTKRRMTVWSFLIYAP